MSGLKSGRISEARAKTKASAIAKEEADSFASLRNDKQKSIWRASIPTHRIVRDEWGTEVVGQGGVKTKYGVPSLRSG